MESIDNLYDELTDRLDRLISLSDGLCALLLEVRQALTNRDPIALQSTIEAKKATCSEIEQMTVALGAIPLRQ